MFIYSVLKTARQKLNIKNSPPCQNPENSIAIFTALTDRKTNLKYQISLKRNHLKESLSILKFSNFLKGVLNKFSTDFNND
jgi:hypothetical protein